MNHKFKKIIEDINVIIKNNFTFDNIIFASVFGSWARNENSESSDLDLIIVFDNSFDFSKKIEIFKKAFIELQKKHDLNIDLKYPGEFLTSLQLEKALKGHGFVLKQDKVSIPLIGEKDWNNFNEYRQWVAALATPSKFIYGDQKKYIKYKEKSLDSLIKIFLLNQDTNTVKIKKIVIDLTKKGKQFLGFCNSAYTIKYLEYNLPAVFERLNSKDIISKSICGDFDINRKKIIKDLPLLIDQEVFNLRSKFVGNLLRKKDRDMLQQSFNFGLDFMLDDKKVLDYYPESEIRNRFEDGVPKNGMSLEKVFQEFKKKIANGSIHQSSSKYLAFPDAGNSSSALMASILEPSINQNLIAIAKSAPTGTFVEMQIIRWLRNLIGFQNSDALPKSALGLGGFMTSCGTLANTTALLVARCKAFPESRKKGLFHEKVKPILIIASDTLNHYSHIAGFWWLGLGEDNIIYVKPNSDFRFNSEDLEKKILEHNDGIKTKVVAVVALAGDSRTTTIEKFHEISKITNKYGVWLHIDACHGGVLIFSKKYRGKLKGLEKVNSISIDPHKGLGVPYASSAILFRDIEDSSFISKSTDITIQSGSSDLGQITPFLGSKPFDSLKLWFLIKHLGLKGIAKLIDYRLNLAKEWKKEIEQSELLESMNDPDLNSVVFSLSPKKIKALFSEKNVSINDIPSLNKKIHDQVYRGGKICIHNFDIFDIDERIFPKNKKVRVLGVTFGNPYTSSFDFIEYISYIEKVAKDIIEKI